MGRENGGKHQMSEIVRLHRLQHQAALTGEAEYLRRRNNKIINKEKRLRTIRIKGLHLLLIFSLMAGAAFLAYKIAISVLTWEKLNVKTYVIKNKPAFKAQQVENILREYRGNILTLSLSGLRKRLLTINEVKDVSISRILPSTVEIHFVLRKPVFQVAIKGKYNIMDPEGVILYTSLAANSELITIRDIDRSELGELVPFLPELSRLKASIEYVSLKKPYGILLKLKRQKEIFYPGNGEFARKINYYLKLRQRPVLSKYNITCVDLRFKDRFYFEYENEREVNN
jgi:cell division septal protein FtsQ